MKQCPKCGSELDTGFNCPKCKAKSYKEIVSEYNTNGEKIYEKSTVKLVQPDPTTAEMLWWLVENGYTIYRYPHKTLEDVVRAAYEKTRRKKMNDKKQNEIEDLSFLVVNAIINNSTAEETAEYLYKHNYRKQSDTVKEFAEQLKKELFANCVILKTISNPQKEDMDSEEAFQIINELVEQYGKEE